MTEAPSRTRIKSYVRREGRITTAQKRNIEMLWPRYGLDAEGDMLDWLQIFGRNAQRVLEIGFGNGENLFQQASAHLDRDFIGIEVHRPGVGRLLQRLDSNGLTNVRVFCTDAVELLSRRFPRQSLHCVQVYFPDPWPKKRHQKRRLVQPEFADLVAAVLSTGGRWLLATDWADYAEQMRSILNNHPGFANLETHGGFIPRPEERLQTRFELRGLRLGHEVFDLAYERKPAHNRAA